MILLFIFSIGLAVACYVNLAIVYCLYSILCIHLLLQEVDLCIANRKDLNALNKYTDNQLWYFSL